MLVIQLDQHTHFFLKVPVWITIYLDHQNLNDNKTVPWVMNISEYNH